MSSAQIIELITSRLSEVGAMIEEWASR